MVIDHETAVFAADAGSAKSPHDLHVHYVGKALSLTLTRLAATANGHPASPPASEAADFRAKLVVSDPYGRAVYSALGHVVCSIF